MWQCVFWKEGERIAREQETGSFVQGFASVLVCFVCVLVGICVWEESFSREFFICEGERGKKAPRRGYGRVILILSKISGKHHTRTQKHFFTIAVTPSHPPSSILHPPSSLCLRAQMDDVIRRLRGRGEQGACKRSSPCSYLHTYRRAPEQASASASYLRSIMNIHGYGAACFASPSFLLVHGSKEVLIMGASAGWLTQRSLLRHKGYYT